MRNELCDRIIRRSVSAITAGIVALGAASSLALAQDVQIQLTIERVTAQNKIDACAIGNWRKADFFSKVSIAGEQFPATEPIINQNDITPNWTFKKRVAIGATGRHEVVVQIWDYSAGICAGDSLIDINFSPGKRDLRLILDVVKCSTEGDLSLQKRVGPGPEVCIVGIESEGAKNKSARVSFFILIDPAK